MKWVLQLVLVVAVLHWDMVESEIEDEDYKAPFPYFQSPTYLQYFANHDRKIYNAMKVYEEELEERVDLLNKYLVDYESSTVAGTYHLDSEEERDKLVVHHPILAFRMLSRFAKEFDALDRHISGGAEEVLSEVMSEAKRRFGFVPNEYDVGEAEDGILNTQFIYDVPSAQIANGQIPGGESILVNLTTEQCYSIAKNAKTSSYYTLAIDWFDEIKRRIKNDPKVKESFSWGSLSSILLKNTTYGINEESLDNDILGVIKEHNDMYQAEFKDGQGHFYSEIVPSVVDGPRPSTKRHDVVSRYSDKGHLNCPENLYARNIALCNGQHIRPPKDESNLKCWLDLRRNPYWTILPLKIELLNESPQIIQFHDFIPDTWISELRKASYAYLRKLGPNDDEIIIGGGSSWLLDNDIPQVPISRKIELATGINVRDTMYTNRLHVSSYALLKFVAVHTDWVRDQYGQRERGLHTTFLSYINDVEKGGFTAFPKLGFYVKPEKGSAILYHTLEFGNGTKDEPVLHGGCPLIYGEKWLATKIMTGMDNMFAKPY